MQPEKSGTVLKLGTRRSLLARAQSGWVAREVERLNPGVKVELVGIDTRGDKILDVSLQSIAGKEFFVAELDEALLSGAVDFAVHSMKDLSLDRSEELVLAAAPRRENPRDVALFGPGVLRKLSEGKTLRIGTSSPRRIENIPAFLVQALPRLGDSDPSVEFVEIRGNVNTRLSRVHEPLESPKNLDGVILAFAGLIRLWADDEARVELKKLLEGVRWMVLPLRECPAAAAQGALAVECRANDARVREILARLNHEDTLRQVKMERGLLEDWGGGCHQKFGATCESIPELGEILNVRGRKPDGTYVDEIRWARPNSPAPLSAQPWDGSRFKGQYQSVPLPSLAPALDQLPLFIAHSRALPEEWTASLRGSESARVFTAGTASWFRLAKKGIWIESCAEGWGFEEFCETAGEGVLQLPTCEQLRILTHESAAKGWNFGQPLATYRVATPADESGDLSGHTHFYWNSGSQFDALRNRVPSGAHHSCGAGKTARHLQRQGMNPTVFPSVEEWRKWLRI